MDLVQSRGGTLYALVNVAVDAAPWKVPTVVALDSAGHLLWRAIVPDTLVGSLMANGAGDVWAVGTGLTRISAAGAVVWHAPMTDLLGWRGALGPDGTAYVHRVLSGQLQVTLQAIAPTGSPSWQMGLGGTVDPRESTPTPFGPPAIAPSGEVVVACLSCQTPVVALDPLTGAIVASATDPNDGGVAVQVSSGVVLDGQGNMYFGALQLAGGRLWELVSATGGGAPRWTSDASQVRAASSLMALGPIWPRPAPPVLVGAATLVANATGGFVQLAPDGSATASVAVPNAPALTALLAGSLRLAEMSFGAMDAGSLGNPTLGTGITDPTGHLAWSDPTLNAASVIPGAGVVYGIKDGQVVAEAAPVAGLDPGAWPMVAHDPGRTSSAAGSW